MVWCFNRIICDYPEYSITVELHWLEHEETVKMCSSFQKFEPPRFCNFRGRKNTGPFHYAMITDAQYHGPLS
jgi:hypothetical protein